MSKRICALTVRDEQIIKLKVLGKDGSVVAEGEASVRRVRRGVSKVAFSLPDDLVVSAQNSKRRLAQ